MTSLSDERDQDGRSKEYHLARQKKTFDIPFTEPSPTIEL